MMLMRYLTARCSDCGRPMPSPAPHPRAAGPYRDIVRCETCAETRWDGADVLQHLGVIATQGQADP